MQQLEEEINELTEKSEKEAIEKAKTYEHVHKVNEQLQETIKVYTKIYFYN